MRLGKSKRMGRVPANRKHLLLSCAIAAMACTLVQPRQAKAQVAPGAFQGTIASSINATRTSLGTGTETITVTNSTATINWAPYDTAGTGNINFLPEGNVATFTSSLGITDYTVLNRIVPTDPTRAIELNGAVLATLEGGSTTGGSIWFYSPGGIVIGANAYFDVGSLLLSTLDVLEGWTADRSGFSADLSTDDGSTSTIQILSGGIGSIHADN